MTQVISALIGAIAAVLVARFEDIVDLFKGKARRVAGVWDGTSYRVAFRPDEPFDPQKESREERVVDTYTASTRQTGRRITGTMTETHVAHDGRKLTFQWKGRVLGDYLLYDCWSAE